MTSDWIREDARIASANGFENARQMAHVVLAPSRIAARVVSGVGFLGAGSILLRGNTVRGITTAASIWAVAPLGLAAGGGLYAAAAIATVIILAGLKPLGGACRARVQSCVIRAVAEGGALCKEQIRKLLRVRRGQVRRLLVTPVETDQAAWTHHLTQVSQADIRAGAGRLRTVLVSAAEKAIQPFGQSHPLIRARVYRRALRVSRCVRSSADAPLPLEKGSGQPMIRAW